MDDPLAEFAATGSQEAFRCLVDRHLGAVYSQCVRRLRDRTLADDVTQSVFIALAKEAPRLPKGTVLGGWLYVVAQHACINAKRSAARRREHERKAAEMRPEHHAPEQRSDPLWANVEPMLDDAMADLATRHRDVLVMRYLEGRSIADVSTALAVSPDAAKQRVSRALARLRQRLAARGVAVPATTLPALLGANALCVPPAGLVEATVNQAMRPIADATWQSTLAEGAIHMATRTMIRSKLRQAAVLAVVLLGASVAAVATAMMVMEREPKALTSAAVPLTIEAEPEVTEVPGLLQGDWEPVDPANKVEREDAAVVKLATLTLKDGYMTMVMTHELGGIVAEKNAVLWISDIRNDTDPKTISSVVTDRGTNAEGQPTNAGGEATIWAFELSAEGVLRIAIPQEGAPVPTTVEAGPGREVFVLKRKAPPTTRPENTNP